MKQPKKQHPDDDAMHSECYIERLFARLLDAPRLLVPSQHQTHYRNKMTYSLPIPAFSDLAEPHINDVCRIVQDFASAKSRTTMREVMVKSTRIERHVLVRVTVVEPVHDEWKIDFTKYMQQHVPSLECLCYNVMNSTQQHRPTKQAPIYFLTRTEWVLEQTPDNKWTYQLGPDTFSEINHHVEQQQFIQTQKWLQQLSVSVLQEPATLIVSGRDVSCFALGFGAVEITIGNKNQNESQQQQSQPQPLFDRVVAIQHCNLVHQDALANFARYPNRNITVHHMSKDTMVQGFAKELSLNPNQPVVGVMTGGRKGLDPRYLEYLISQENSIQAIVYNSCSTKSLVRDMRVLVGSGAFAVEEFKRHEFFPNTPYTASLTKLVRRRRHSTLIMPVGPAGMGKSTLSQGLASKFPHLVQWWERDAVFAQFRNTGLGLNKTKTKVHEHLMDFLQQQPPTTTGHVVRIVDSTNGNPEARQLYTQVANPERVVYVVFQPPPDRDAMALLLQRTVNRLGDNSAGHPSFPTTVAEQEFKHQQILRGIQYPTRQEEEKTTTSAVLFVYSNYDDQDTSSVAFDVFCAITVSEELVEILKKH